MISGDLIDGMLMFFLFQDGFNHVFCRPYDNGLFPGSCEIGMAIELGGS